MTSFARVSWWLMRLSPGLIDWLNREGWRRRRKIDIAGDLASGDQTTSEKRNASGR